MVFGIRWWLKRYVRVMPKCVEIIQVNVPPESIWIVVHQKQKGCHNLNQANNIPGWVALLRLPLVPDLPAGRMVEMISYRANIPSKRTIRGRRRRDTVFFVSKHSWVRPKYRETIQATVLDRGTSSGMPGGLYDGAQNIPGLGQSVLR